MPPRPSVQKISISTGTILRTVLVLVAIALLWFIRDILLYIFIAFLLAGVIYPFAAWGKKYHIPKSVTVIVFYLVMLGLLGVAFALLIPALLDQTSRLINDLGGAAGPLHGLFTFLTRLSSRPASLLAPSNLTELGTQVEQVFGSVFGTLVDVFGSLAGVVIVIVMSFYLIAEDLAVKDLFRNVIPGEYQEPAAQAMWQVVEKLGAWLRGQLILGLAIGILYLIGYSIIGVPYALLLSMFGGLVEFIPYLGPFIAAVPAVFLALTISPARALVTLAVIVVIQQLEANVIAPKVMQKAVGMNPVVSIVAFLVGAKLFGLVGAVFAIPIATAISVAIAEAVRFRRLS